MATPAVSLRDLVVRRPGGTMLQGVSLDVEPGAVTGLLGPTVPASVWVDPAAVAGVAVVGTVPLRRRTA